jgi:hypothetical protein
MRGALANAAFYEELTAHRCHDAVANRQSQPRPDIDRFGGEEGYEDLAQYLWRHSFTRVADLDDHTPSGVSARRD